MKMEMMQKLYNSSFLIVLILGIWQCGALNIPVDDALKTGRDLESKYKKVRDVSAQLKEYRRQLVDMRDQKNTYADQVAGYQEKVTSIRDDIKNLGLKDQLDALDKKSKTVPYRAFYPQIQTLIFEVRKILVPTVGTTAELAAVEAIKPLIDFLVDLQKLFADTGVLLDTSIEALDKLINKLDVYANQPIPMV